MEGRLIKADRRPAENMTFSRTDPFMSQLTPELSDVGGPERPNSEPSWPARIRSSDLVKLQGHGRFVVLSLSTLREPRLA